MMSRLIANSERYPSLKRKIGMLSLCLRTSTSPDASRYISSYVSRFRISRSARATGKKAFSPSNSNQAAEWGSGLFFSNREAMLEVFLMILELDCSS
ncbi:hypothetical protein D3C77_537300 [compost metagenome]